jgi:hypothetical protein
MNTLNCEFVREVYADVLHGHAEPAQAEAIRRHVETCGDCRSELALVRQLLAAPLDVPAGLEARVLTNVRATRPAWPRVRWLLAAVLAFAVLGGALLFRSVQRERLPESLVVREDQSGLGVMGVEGALVSGSATLRDLSIEELEQLLGEMES